MTGGASDIALAELRELWRQRQTSLAWSCLFTLPTWLEAWSSTLGRDANRYVKVVRSGNEVIGAAALSRDQSSARFLGDTEVCDYQDLVLAPGREAEAVAALWESWVRDGIHELDLRRVRPESHVLQHLVPRARSLGAEVAIQADTAAVELRLPDSWDAYLACLDKKQRHEIRRKLRRLNGEGRVAYRGVRTSDELAQVADEFFAVFRGNREDKAAFLDPAKEAYFAALMEAAARDGLLNLGVLECDGTLAAAALCFDHCGRTHLYNNGYRQEFAPLSVGLLCKVMSLRDSIEGGKETYDMLAGDEAYKFRLGGVAVSLSRCVIRIPSP